MTEVTIGIPFYNDQEYLRDSIKSVLQQTFVDWRLILVDDGGTDGSLEIAKEFEKKDKRITVISDGQNRKLPARLNQIINLTKTKYMARMDADDIMHPRRIEKQYKVLEEHSDVDVVGSNVYVIDQNNNVTGIRYADHQLGGLQKVSEFLHPSIMGRTSWFRKNLYDEKAIRMEDDELWYRTYRTSGFKMITEPLFFYREVALGAYKKYKLVRQTKMYILEKYNNEPYWRRYFARKRIMGDLCTLLHFVGQEQFLVWRRNRIRFKDKKNYKVYI